VSSVPTEAMIELEVPAPIRAAGAEPFPGYKLLEPLGRGGFGEVWKCMAPGGLPKAIKFVSGQHQQHWLDGRVGPAQQELQALEHCKAIRHPFILSMERLEIVGGDLIIVMELADRNLHNVRADYQAAGQVGIPRAELLSYLREVAEVLDYLHEQHGLQHLDIKPQNVFLTGSHVKVADFGLAASLHQEGGGPATGTPLYTAPEIFQGQLSPQCDQYSLAITYQELLTGTFPFQGRTTRQLMLNHLAAAPNLEPLPEGDRPHVARALAKEAADRFPSCLAFIHSLLPTNATIVLPRVAGDLTETPPPAMETVGLRDTPPLTPRPRLADGADTVPGYQLLTCLSQSPVADLWQAHGPDGRERWVLLLNAQPERSDALVAKLKPLQHPALPATDILRSGTGRVALACDPCQPTLQERCNDYRREGQPGIPREELLGYLSDVAAALDELQQQHKLAHGSLQARTIVVQGESVLLFQHGLAPILAGPQGKPAGGLVPRYAAPELAETGASAAGDQYSLALIYADLLLGVQPRAARGSSRAVAKLDLDLLPAFDRPILARALQVRPSQRYPSCSDFIQALVHAPRIAAPTQQAIYLADIAPLADLTDTGRAPSAPCSVPDIVARWLTAATGALQLAMNGSWHYLIHPNHVLEHRYRVRLIPGVFQLKLQDLEKRWSAKVLRQDDESFICRVPIKQKFWQRCFGGDGGGFEVQIHLQPIAGPAPQLAQAHVRVEPYGPVTAQTAQDVAEIGPEIITSVRSYLGEVNDQRSQVRWPCTLPVRLYPVLPNLRLDSRRVGACRNLAFDGINFRTEQPLPGEFVYVAAPDVPGGDDIALLVQVLHSAPDPNGGVEIGGRFGAAANWGKEEK
jgi:serine/threonine protein kinase